ncbi:MAG: porin [Selenomonas sp.]|nr:porin [Selenomonas sp.]
MKKTLVSALTTALVVGAASTTFAAANPFSDVPADHWAYDAVTQLAADGVVTGYGDGKFNGDKNITRYEMAQIVAKAMAKPNVSGNDKALVDKLAAEFADELNNLGVRVSNLERNADMVKWNGTAEYTISRNRKAGQSDNADKHTNNVLFRLEPSAEINSNWHVKARLDANSDLAEDKGDTDGTDGSGNVVLKRVWAQGDYSNFQVKFGKFAQIDDDSIFDTTFSGAQVSFGSATKLTLGAGRLNNADTDATDVANYQYAGLDHTFGKLSVGADYHHLNSMDVKNYGEATTYKNGTTDEANIWLLKGTYTFSKNVAMNGFYAENHDADNYEKAGSAQVSYKGAQAENKGTWGAWVAYRHLGQNVDFFNTFDAVKANQKAWEVGANYTPFKNVVAQVRYGYGKQLSDDKDVSNIFGRVNFFF